jgi:hypothetical protein
MDKREYVWQNMLCGYVCDTLYEMVCSIIADIMTYKSCRTPRILAVKRIRIK